MASVQDLRDSVAADVAAERLGRSPHELRRLLRAGQVCAHRRAGRWWHGYKFAWDALEFDVIAPEGMAHAPI